MSKPLLLVAGLLIAVLAATLGFKFQHSMSGNEDEVVVSRVDDAESALPKVADMPGRPRPEFSLPDQQGHLRNVSEWDNRVLAINFWATWCPPCRDEIPEFIELQQEYGEQGLQFVGIALETAEEVSAFAAELGINYPILVGELEAIKIAEQYGNRIGALPYTVIIDRGGVIRHVQQGVLSRAQAEQAIKPLL